MSSPNPITDDPDPDTASTAAPTDHSELIAWVEQWGDILKPANVHWCDGSEEEYRLLCDEMVAAGTFRKLSHEKRPNSYLALSDPRDVARVEEQTFIATADQEDAGPTNNWRDPAELKEELSENEVQKQKYQSEKKTLLLVFSDLLTHECVLRPCNQKVILCLRRESQILGSRTAASIAVDITIHVAARPKPRLMMSGPTMWALCSWVLLTVMQM